MRLILVRDELLLVPAVSPRSCALGADVELATADLVVPLFANVLAAVGRRGRVSLVLIQQFLSHIPCQAHVVFSRCHEPQASVNGSWCRSSCGQANIMALHEISAWPWLSMTDLAVLKDRAERGR